MAATPSASPKLSPLDWIFRILGFLTLVAIAFSLPAPPSAELDSSWRMAIGKFFQEGRQFGTEVVFTYGPLGWSMGKTYWNGGWGLLIGWQLVQAVVMATLVYWHAFRLQGYSRVFFLLFYFLFGLTYQDAIQQTAIILAGLELIRRTNQPWRWSSLALVLLLVLFALVKFTNLVLAFFVVLLAGALELWVRRKVSALRVPAIFLGLFLAGWMLCGQHLGNLPAYFKSSLEISSGYQDAMGFPCPPIQLYLGLTVAGLLSVYLLLNLATQTDRVRGLALFLAASAYLYLNWKHGFIRADGHQIGFYYAALTIITGLPLLLEDGPRLRLPKILLLTAAGLTTLVSLELVLPGLVRGVLAMDSGAIDRNVNFALRPAATHGSFAAAFSGETDRTRLARTSDEVGKASLDVLGFEQGVALFNGFNYQPRPVFQSYSAYTPYLSRLNHNYYASDRAPEYALFKLQTIDGRLATMDDPHVLRLLVQRYTYRFTDQGFALWKRKPGPFNAADFETKPLRTVNAKMGEKIELADLAGQNLWVEIDYRFSLLGKLRRFLYKPALVQLRVVDDKGVESLYRLPQPIAATGFMLNPIVNDLLEFMRSAGGEPTRRVQSVTVEVAPADRAFVSDKIRLAVSALPPSDAGKSFFQNADRAKFHMFMVAPISYEALNPPNEDAIDGRRIMIMHAPSQMVFEVPAGATKVTGAYGFVAGAYSNGGKTNGAEFLITWTDGNAPVILSERYLNPISNPDDRGLQKFELALPKGTGRVTMQVKPGLYGEYAFDWTGWTAIEFK
jgi:hypothetical protein